MAERILVVEDEAPIRELLSFNLTREGFRVEAVEDGLEAMRSFKSLRPDLIILDLMLPGQGGLEVCRRVRQESTVPIIILSAREEELDRVLGLEMGADDYVTKPFSPRELLARVRAVLRRTAGQNSPDALRSGELRLERDSRRVFVGSAEIELTRTEFDLLLTLMEARGRVISRETLLNAVWGRDFFGDPRTVDVHIRHLREKLGEDASERRHIETVRGIGYRFRADR